MFCLDTRLRSFQEELFEASVPEFLDHGAQRNGEGLREQGASRLGDPTNTVTTVTGRSRIRFAVTERRICHATMMSLQDLTGTLIFNQPGVANDVTMDTACSKRCIVFSIDSHGSTEVFRGERATKEKG